MFVLSFVVNKELEMINVIDYVIGKYHKRYSINFEIELEKGKFITVKYCNPISNGASILFLKARGRSSLFVSSLCHSRITYKQTFTRDFCAKIEYHKMEIPVETLNKIQKVFAKYN